MDPGREREGELFAIGTLLTIGSMPVLIKRGVGVFHPLFFAAAIALLAAIVLLPFALRAGISQLFSRKHGPGLFLAGMLSSGAAMLVFMFGASMTSAINASILPQAEVLYSLVISYFLLREKITLWQVAFSSLIVLGTLTVVYNGTGGINLGDILVLSSSIFYQLSHVVSKRLVNEVDPVILSFSRAVYAGIILMPLAFILVPAQFTLVTSPYALGLIAVQSVIGYGLGFFTWYSALKRINLSKATGLIMPNPLISVALAMLWLGEIPSPYQMAGFAITMLGIYLLTRVKSETR